MSEKTVFVSLPISTAIDAVQLRLQILADELSQLNQSPEAPRSSELEDIYKELINLAQIMKEVENKENEQ
jgi:hypothetical protein